jgi:hypothetical protein
LVFLEVKLVGRIEKYFIVGLLEIFKDRTSKIHHIGLGRQFEFYQKVFHDFFVF